MPTSSKIYIVYNAINLRARADPPLSKHHFGNVVWVSTSEVAAEDGGAELIRKVRRASEALDAGYVAGLKDREKQLEEIMVQAQASS